MGYGTSMIVILACMSFALYLLPADMGGMTSMYYSMTQNFGTDAWSLTNILNLLETIIMGDATSTLGAVAVGAYLASSYGVIYLIPAIIGARLVTFFLLPVSNLSTIPGMPPEISLFFSLILNTMIVIIFINFIRGGDL